MFWYFFSILSGRINSIPFHERPVSQDTSLEYQQQGNRSNLKIHFFSLRGGIEGTLGNFFREKKLCFGYPEIIGDQMRYLRNKFETKVGE